MLYREMVQLRSEGSRGGNRPDIRLTPVPALCVASISDSGPLSGNLAGYSDEFSLQMYIFRQNLPRIL